MMYMLDTNICIYAMKRRPEKVLQRFQKALDEGLCISSITLAVLMLLFVKGNINGHATAHKLLQ